MVGIHISVGAGVDRTDPPQPIPDQPRSPHAATNLPKVGIRISMGASVDRTDPAQPIQINRAHRARLQNFQRLESTSLWVRALTALILLSRSRINRVRLQNFQRFGIHISVGAGVDRTDPAQPIPDQLRSSRAATKYP